MKPPLLVIAGPTGVGKTAAAVALAARLPIEVVSADSRQVYRGMDIGTAKPTRQERAALRLGQLVQLAPEDGIGRRRRIESANERANVEPGAPDHDRQVAARPDGLDGGARLAGEARGVIAVVGIAHVDQVVRDGRALLERRLGGPDIHAAIHLA